MSAPQGATSVTTSHADAIVASQGSATQTSSTSTVRAAIVSLGGELFTIDLQNVREVFVVESVTPVPGMPSGLIGVTNLRGSVVPLLDLRQMIGVAAETVLKYAVVVKHGNWQVGVLVDTVPEIRTLSKDQFLPAPVGTGDGGNPFVSTVVKLEDRLRGVLETSAVLSHFEGTG
jgi:purine-binding chemotaxis protein CheW